MNLKIVALADVFIKLSISKYVCMYIRGSCYHNTSRDDSGNINVKFKIKRISLQAPAGSRLFREG